MQSGAEATVRTKERTPIMSAPDFEVKHPEQLMLVGTEVLEIVLRVGVIADLDHVQFQLDVTSATTGELQQCAARHHVPLDRALIELFDWTDRLHMRVFEATGPF